MNYKGVVLAVIAGLFLPMGSDLGFPSVNALMTPPLACNNTVSESWSPSPGVGVTIRVSACVVVTGGHSWGVHSVMSSANSTSIVPQNSSGQFQGYKAGCGYYCPKEYYYLKDFKTGPGKFPNLSYITGPFPVLNFTSFNEDALMCVFTYALSFTVLYQPTGETHNFALFTKNGFCP